MPSVPAWFKRELRVLDPRYFVIYNDDFCYWEVKMKLDFSRKIDLPGSYTSDRTHHVATPASQLRVRMHNPTVAIFEDLNDRAMLELRQRRQAFLSRSPGQDDEVTEIAKRNKEARAKREEVGQQMVVDGFMEDHKYKRRKTWVMPSPA